MTEKKSNEESRRLVDVIDEQLAEEPQLNSYDLFCMKHMARLTMWMRDHKEHQKFPIVDLGNGNFHWLNRAERRRK